MSPQPSHPHPFQPAPPGVPAAHHWPHQRFTPPAAAQPLPGASLQGGPVQTGPGRLDSAAVAQKIAEALPQLGISDPVAAVAAAQAAAAAAVSVLQEQQEVQRQQVNSDLANRRCTSAWVLWVSSTTAQGHACCTGTSEGFVVPSGPCPSFHGQHPVILACLSSMGCRILIRSDVRSQSPSVLKLVALNWSVFVI